GAGIVAEDGSETLNVIDHNFSAGFTGGTPTDRVTEGTEGLAGDAFWMAGLYNIYTNNVAADGAGNGIGKWTPYSVNKNTPLFRGAENMMGSAGQLNKESGLRSDNQGFVTFSGNEAYGFQQGFHLGGALRSVLKNSRLWNLSESAIQLYDGPNDKFWFD